MSRFINAALLALVALFSIGGTPVYSQDSSPDGPNDLSPDEMQRALSQNLPPGWQISTPAMDLGTWQAKVSVPARWHGSPISAAINLCPARSSPIWQTIPKLQIIVLYQKRDWPAYDCEP